MSANARWQMRRCPEHGLLYPTHVGCRKCREEEGR